MSAMLALVGAAGPCWAAEGPSSANAATTAARGEAGTCVCDPAICDPRAGGPDPNAFRHDGFFLRLTAGPGYMWGRGEPSTEQDGYAGVLGVSVGSMLSENFGLFFDMSGTNAFRSDLSIEGTEDSTYNVVFQTGNLGIGATYYLMPANVYASLAFGAGVLYTTAYSRLDENFVLTGGEASKFGPALTVSIGKEWWLHPEWGIGLAAVYGFLSVNGEDLGEYTVDNVQHVTARISATFN